MLSSVLCHNLVLTTPLLAMDDAEFIEVGVFQLLK